MPLPLLLFVIMPIAELYVLITVGSQIGAMLTIGLVVLTAMFGVALLRQQGFATLLRGRQRLAQGELPAAEVAEGLILATGGVLLMVPGFVTDILGLALLLPPSRRALLCWVNWRIPRDVRVSAHRRGPQSPGPGQARAPQGGRTRTDAQVIEGEFRREEGFGDH